MADKNEGGGIQPKLMAAEMAADWQNSAVIIQEKSKEGIQLLNPMVFVIPMDAFILTACNLITQKLERERLERVRQLGLSSVPKGPKLS